MIRKPRFWLINRIIVSFALESDGWFAGLVFDPQGRARFTVATFVRHGGRGGGNAAMISAGIARFLIENGANLK